MDKIKKSRNIKLLIEYDGTNYCGWQIQKKQASVQGTILKAIKKITRENVILYGASRTDSGVHAIGQVANFFTRLTLPPFNFMRALNANLPPDIVIKKVEDAPPCFKAQFKTKRKTYLYTILNGPLPSALYRNFNYFVGKKRLSLSLMKQGAKYLKGKHNFKSFTNEGSTPKHYEREIYAININRKKDIITIKFIGNAFLYNMIRNIVGTLIQVGRGKIGPKDIKKILESCDRKKAGAKVPARGLCLIKVEY